MTSLTDDQLRRQYGCILHSKAPLRDSETDEPTPQPCRGCPAMLTTMGEEARHLLRHATEGTLVPYLARSHPTVSFQPRTEWEAQRGHGAGPHPLGGMYGWEVPAVTLDAASNAVRVTCDECGDYAYLQGDTAAHGSEATPYDHAAVIAFVIGGEVQVLTTINNKR